MGYRIRQMRPDDYDDVVSLWEKTEGVSLGGSDSREAIASFLARNPGHSFVACIDSKLVAAVLCGHDGRRGYLHHLAVEKQHRRKGIGRDLIGACLSALEKLGIQKCNIFLFSGNEEARTFWVHMGWLSRADLDIMQRVI